MPHITDVVPLADPFLDRRTKLLPCQREMVKYWYDRGFGIRAITRMFKVNRRLIQFILFPERKKKNLSDRQDRGGSVIYYERVKHNKAIKSHRKYKYKILKSTIHHEKPSK